VAPTVKTPYGILADRALLQVVQTALALPVTMSNADIDVQANMISKKLYLKDLPRRNFRNSLLSFRRSTI
jgi:Protein of unknown function (DUF1217)